MIKLLVKIIVLLFVLFAFVLFFCRFDNRQKITDPNVLRVEAANNSEQLDFLFVGPSYIYNGIVPAMFDSVGLKTFDLGVATSGPYFSELIIDNYLKASPKPRCICMAINYTIFSDRASDAWGLYPIHRYLSPPVSNEEVFMKYASLEDYLKMTRNSFKKGFVNFFNSQSGLDTSLLETIKKARGYAKSYEVTSAEKRQSEQKLYRPFLKSNYSFQKEDKILFLANKYRKQGIKVVFLRMPTYKLEDYFTSEFKENYERFVTKTMSSGMPFIACPKTGYDSTCFSNTDHMNYKGARQYSAYLLHELQL